MSKPVEGHSVNDHFAGKDPSVREVYDWLLSVLREIGPVAEEAKKTSIHLVRTSALAGIETRKSFLLLNLKADHRVEARAWRRPSSSRRGGFTSKGSCRGRTRWTPNWKVGSGTPTIATTALSIVPVTSPCWAPVLSPKTRFL